MRLSFLLFCVYVIFVLDSCSGTLKLGKGGEIVGGTVFHLKCTKPQKRYATTVNAALKGSVKTWNTVSGADLDASIKTEVVKLTDYSQQGLDLDLILFRICEMGNNKNLNQAQVNDITTLAIKTWNNKLSINEQKSIINQLNVELNSNLKTANQLKLNSETILSTLNLLSGNQMLRNPKIEILHLFFPSVNLDNQTSVQVVSLVDSSISKYVINKLDTNTLEKEKFSAAGKVIALTLDHTLPTINSLADKDGKRYTISSAIWNANSSNLSRIEVFDITTFQKTYSELNSLRTNYDIIIGRASDYLQELNTFFKSPDHKIKRDDIINILTAERLAYDLIIPYSKSLTENIDNLTKLQQSVQDQLK